MDITLQSAQLTQDSGRAGSSVRVTFTPPLQAEQVRALQGRAVQVQLAVPSGQSTPVLILPSGEQIPVKLEPQPALPQNVSLRVQSSTQAAAQVIKNTPQTQISTTPSTTPQTPSTITNVPTFPLPTGPQLPVNTPMLMVNVTPPTQAPQAQLQTLSALTPTATNTAILPPPARVQIQASLPLPLGTRATVTLASGVPTTATLTQITPPAPATQTILSQPTQAQTLPVIPTLPLPQSQGGIGNLLSQSSVTLPANTALPTATFTARAGALLPLAAAQPTGTVSQYLPTPSGQNATLNVPQALPQGTPVTLQVSQLTPSVPIVTVTNIANTFSAQTVQQLPLPLAATHLPNIPTPPTTPAGQVNTFTVTAQNQNTLTLQTPVGEKISIQWPTPQGVTLPPVGSQVSGQLLLSDGALQFQVLAVNTAGVLPTPQHVVTQYSQQWPTLTQAMALLQQGSGGEVSQLKQNVPTLATPPLNFAAQLVAMAEASQTSNASKFLSDDLLNLLRQLGIDFTPDLANLSTVQNRQENDGWRGFLFPYVENEQDDARQGSFFYRQNKDDEDGENPSTQTRFVVQLGLSELGDIALDGIYTIQQESSEKALQLRLHADKNWPEDMTSGLISFAETLFEELGINGQFTFTNKPLVENPLS